MRKIEMSISHSEACHRCATHTVEYTFEDLGLSESDYDAMTLAERDKYVGDALLEVFWETVNYGFEVSDDV